jgi:Transposase DDE domain
VRKRLLPGALRRYSDLALACALVLKAVFHLSLRATQGFLASVRELMALTLPIPDYNTVAYGYTIKFVAHVTTLCSATSCEMNLGLMRFRLILCSQIAR